MLHFNTHHVHASSNWRKSSLIAACLAAASCAPGAAAQFTGFGPFENIELTPSAFVYNGDYSDLNGDGRVDVIQISDLANLVFVLLNNGDGSFDITSYTVLAPLAVEIADFNNDGHPDIAVLSLAGVRDIHLFENDGEGSFTEAASFETSFNSLRMAVADFNGDEIMDILIGDHNGPTHMYIGMGDYQFAPPISMPGSLQAVEMVPTDMTGDGVVDVVMASAEHGYSEIRVLQNNGAGVLLQTTTFQLPDVSVYGMTVADANNDGLLDICARVSYVFVQNHPGEFWIYLANGVNSFQAPIKLPPVNVNGLVPYANDIQFADLDGDGLNDMVTSASYGSLINGVTEHRLHVYRGHSSGAQQYVESYVLPSGTGGLGFFDLNGDYSPDLFARAALKPIIAANLTPMSPPGHYELLSPPNGAQGLLVPGYGPSWPGAVARLDWSDSAAFHRTYEAYIKRLGEDEGLVFSAVGLTESHVEIPEGVLEPGRRYQWTVRARNSLGLMPPLPIQVFEFTTAVPADLNGDGAVNGSDLARLLANWGIVDP